MANAMNDESERPLVITAIGGGLMQWSVTKPGAGMPRLYTLDFDLEGAPDWEIADLADRYEAARDALAEYGDPEDADTIASMTEGINEYREMLANGETPGRYR